MSFAEKEGIANAFMPKKMKTLPLPLPRYLS